MGDVIDLEEARQQRALQPKGRCTCRWVNPTQIDVDIEPAFAAMMVTPTLRLWCPCGVERVYARVGDGWLPLESQEPAAP